MLKALDSAATTRSAAAATRSATRGSSESRHTVKGHVAEKLDARAGPPHSGVLQRADKRCPGVGGRLGAVCHGRVQRGALLGRQGAHGVDVAGHEEELHADNHSHHALDQEQPGWVGGGLAGAGRQPAATRGVEHRGMSGRAGGGWWVERMHCCLHHVVMHAHGRLLAHHCQPRRPPLPSRAIRPAASGAPSACDTISPPISQPSGMVMRCLL